MHWWGRGLDEIAQEAIGSDHAKAYQRQNFQERTDGKSDLCDGKLVNLGPVGSILCPNVMLPLWHC